HRDLPSFPTRRSSDLEVYPAREEPVEGVSGKLVVDALVEVRPGMTVGWTPALEDGARFLARRARPGDRVLTLGAGDVDRAGLLVDRKSTRLNSSHEWI